MPYLCAMKAEDQNKNILYNLGIESLNEMQIAARHAIIKERNVLLLSPTGSGKTLAFLLPVLQLLDEDITKVQCLELLTLLGQKVKHKKLTFVKV